MATDGLSFEDLQVGETIDCGSVEITEAEMLEFAGRYDPQPTHTDPEAASDSMFGDLIASGWLTCALSMRLLVTGYLADRAALGGRGMDEIRWERPVFAGDTLSVTAKLVEKSAGSSPARGEARVTTTTKNDDGEVVLTMDALVLVAKDDPGT